MPAYVLLLGILHFALSLAFGAAYFWTHGPSARLGDVVALFVVSMFVTWLTHTNRKRPMTKSEFAWFVGLSGLYIFCFEVLGQLHNMEFARAQGQTSSLWTAVIADTLIGALIVWVSVQLVQTLRKRLTNRAAA